MAAVCGITHISNLDQRCGTPIYAGGGDGEGRVWHDGDPSGVEPTEGFGGVDELNGLYLMQPHP
jgi:hypothetical protein